MKGRHSPHRPTSSESDYSTKISYNSVNRVTESQASRTGRARPLMQMLRLHDLALGFCSYTSRDWELALTLDWIASTSLSYDDIPRDESDLGSVPTAGG